MAESPASQVYSPQVLGDAVLLGSGLGPLTVLRQEAAARARAKAAAAKLKQQQEDSDARNAVPIAANGWLPHTEQLKAAVQTALATNAKTYQRQDLTPYQKKMAAYEQLNIVKQVEDLSNEQGKKRVDVEALAKSDSRYNKDEILQEFDNQIYGLDPATGQKNKQAQDLRTVDIAKLDDIVNNGKFLNRDEVFKKFIKQEADSENNRVGQAALPGGFGLTTAFQSNIFARDKNNRPIYNADGSQKIADLPALMARAKNDPFMAKVLAQDALNLQNQAGAEQMRQGSGYEQLSPEMQARMQALGTVGDAQMRVSLPTDLAPYGKTKTSSIESYRARPQPRAAAALKANQATATDTDGFVLDVPTETVPTSSTVYNDGSNGMLKFMHPDTPKFVTNGTKEVPYTTHYANVGTTFATSKNPHITLAATTDGISTLGADGEATKYYGTGSNTMTEFKANSRYMVLTLDGKRIPGQGDVGKQTGERSQTESLARLSPADRQRVKYKPMYEGSVQDKPKTAGDGAGSAAKIIGYKDGNGTAIPDAMVPAMEKAGMKLFAQYDQTTNLRRAIHDATPQMDAQAMAQTPGYNPRVLTPAQARISKLVDEGGGETLSPYRAARVERAAPAAPASAPLYVPKGAAAKAAAPKAAAVEQKANTNSSYYTKRKK